MDNPKQIILESQLMKLQDIVCRSDFIGLARLINYPHMIGVSKGRYPSTFVISDGVYNITMGYAKLNFILEYLLDVAYFALFGEVRLPAMKGEKYGRVVLWLPSNQNPRVFLTRRFAQYLCSGMGLIANLIE